MLLRVVTLIALLLPPHLALGVQRRRIGTQGVNHGDALSYKLDLKPVKLFA
jgi:hypothetical protein